MNGFVGVAVYLFRVFQLWREKMDQSISIHFYGKVEWSGQTPLEMLRVAWDDFTLTKKKSNYCKKSGTHFLEAVETRLATILTLEDTSDRNARKLKLLRKVNVSLHDNLWGCRGIFGFWYQASFRYRKNSCEPIEKRRTWAFKNQFWVEMK